MLIISKYTDYYDSVAFSKGVDKSIIYKRENSLVLERKIIKHYDKKDFYFPSYCMRSSSQYYNRYGLIRFETYIVGFCGKMYPLMVTSTVIKKNQYQDETVTEYIYDLEIIKEHTKKYCSNWAGNFSDYEAMLTNKIIENLFFEYKVPSFIINESGFNVFLQIKTSNDGKNLELNPNLKQIQFYKVFETAAAFQEIEMFISGVLGVDSQKTIEVSDKSKIEGHGFDYKTSFRKDKKK